MEESAGAEGSPIALAEQLGYDESIIVPIVTAQNITNLFINQRLTDFGL